MNDRTEIPDSEILLRPEKLISVPGIHFNNTAYRCSHNILIKLRYGDDRLHNRLRCQIPPAYQLVVGMNVHISKGIRRCVRLHLQIRNDFVTRLWQRAPRILQKLTQKRKLRRKLRILVLLQAEIIINPFADIID